MEYSPSLGIQVEEEMRIGSYIGDGTASRDIDIGFTPKAVWIYVQEAGGNAGIGCAVDIEHNYSSSFNGGPWSNDPTYFQGITTNGFKTGNSATGLGLNFLDHHYFWIAAP